MSEKEWAEKALSTSWFGQRVDELDHDQLIIMIGNLLEEIEFKDKLIDNYLDRIEKDKQSR